jgi:hypothetical protein
MASRLRRRVPLGRVDKGTNIWTYGPATQTHTATGILADEMMIGDDWSALRGVSTERATLRGIVGSLSFAPSTAFGATAARVKCGLLLMEQDEGVPAGFSASMQNEDVLWAYATYVQFGANDSLMNHADVRVKSRRRLTSDTVVLAISEVFNPSDFTVNFRVEWDLRMVVHRS